MSLCAVDPKKYCQCQPDEGTLCVNRVPVGYKLLKDSTMLERCVEGQTVFYKDCSHCLRKFVGANEVEICKVCSQEISNV